jgi:DNA (cytosine-5)-methyltransferase 1
MSGYNYIDLFHGIGGFALGAYWAGVKFENHYCSDIEPYAQQLYKLRFPDSIQLGDITKIKTEDLPDGEWIITGGFPCQDISCAGKGLGLSGSRSGLWVEYWRLIRDLRPRFAIIENVEAITSKGWKEIIESLAEIRYNVEWQIIPATTVSGFHRRNRLFAVAYPQSARQLRKDKLENNKKNMREWWRCDSSSLLDIRSKRQDKQTKCFYAQPPLLGKYNGVSNRVDRLKGLGNAIVPQIAELLFKQIKELI